MTSPAGVLPPEVLPVVADSSVWLAWLLDTADADRFAPVFTAATPPLVPVIVIFEVLRWYASHRQDQKPSVKAVLRKGEVIVLSAEIASAAANLGVRHKLAMADAIILATARAHGAELWTRDADFRDLSGVRYFAPP